VDPPDHPNMPRGEQGYLARKKTPTPLILSLDPRYAYGRVQGGAISFELGMPVELWSGRGARRLPPSLCPPLPRATTLQGYLAHKKTHPPRTLP
jgi:hypothetical protein